MLGRGMMKEGWNSESYFIVLDAGEIEPLTEAYGLPVYLPGHRLVAIQGWDDFIVENADGDRFVVPSVPMSAKGMTPLQRAPDWSALQRDERLTGKIKWYIKPVVFGGDPNQGPNMTWVDHPTHQKAVRYWNDLYREVEGKTGSRTTV